jgi:ATP-dependent Clp protease protease subunit
MAETALSDVTYQEVAASGVALKQRRIFLTGVITPASYNHVASALTTLNQTKGWIDLILNSTGGEVAQGYAIYELIKHSKNKVRVYGIGQVMSIASAIIQGGHKRYMSPYCRFMIHNGTISYEDMDVGKLASHVKDIMLDTDVYYQILCEKSGLNRSTIKRMCDQEKYMTAQECLEMGLIDAIKVP